MAFGNTDYSAGVEGISLRVGFSNAAGEPAIQAGPAFATAVNGQELSVDAGMDADPGYKPPVV